MKAGHQVTMISQALTKNLTSRPRNASKITNHGNFCDYNQHTLAHAESNCESNTTTHLFLGPQPPLRYNQTQSINQLTSLSHQSGRNKPVSNWRGHKEPVAEISEGTLLADSLKSEIIKYCDHTDSS